MWLTPRAGEGYRVGQLSLCSRVLLLPLGVPTPPPRRRWHAPRTVFPKAAEFGGRSPTPMWEMSPRVCGAFLNSVSLSEHWAYARMG